MDIGDCAENRIFQVGLGRVVSGALAIPKEENAANLVELKNKIEPQYKKLSSENEQIKTIYNIQNINIIDTAEISNTPCNINHIKDMAIALMAGIFASGVLILILYILDDTIKSEKDIPVNLKLETIGTIPNTNKTNNELIIETDPKSYIVECLKTTRTNILYASNINKKKAILFTSARI